MCNKMIDAISISLGITSIGLAIGLSWYRNYQEKQTRIKNEVFFVKQITSNLKRMKQYFLDVEKKTTYNEEQETDTYNMMSLLKTFYLRNEQEMKDILYQTKLYLPFWSNLSAADKQTVNEILSTFSWLLYDYYPSSLPGSIRKNAVINSRQALYDKKNWIIDTIDHLQN